MVVIMPVEALILRTRALLVSAMYRLSAESTDMPFDIASFANVAPAAWSSPLKP
jgi:hypothetical protein